MTPWREGNSVGVRSGGRPARPGSGSPRFGRVFGFGEDPLAWSLPLLRAGDLHVRLHLAFVVVAVSELLLSTAQDRIGAWHVGTALACLLSLIGLREIGRWVIARTMGADPAPVVLWPLGSVAPIRPPGEWRREFVVAIGGLTVNMLLWPVLGGVLWLGGASWDQVVFNPFKPSAVLGGIGSPVLAAVWWLYYVNAMLVGLHALLPMLPMDAGRALEAWSRRRLTPRGASWRAARVGLAIAGVLFVAAMSAGQTRLMGLGVFGALVCWLQIRRLTFLDTASGGNATLVPVNDASMAPAVGLEHLAELTDEDLLQATGDDLEMADAGAGVRRDEQTHDDLDVSVVLDDFGALDAVLEKISRLGIGSLTPEERGLLRRETERRNAR